MPSKNVYVSEAGLPLFEQAAELAGGMSAAVAAGLRLYVAQREKERKGTQMQVIEIEVDDGPVVTTKRFTGRQILRYEVPEGLRTRSFRVYETAKGQYAVYIRDNPNWAALSSSDGDDAVWQDPQTWQGPWWRSGERALRVFPDLDSMGGELPEEVSAAAAQALRRPTIEELDI